MSVTRDQCGAQLAALADLEDLLEDRVATLPCRQAEGLLVHLATSLKDSHSRILRPHVASVIEGLAWPIVGLAGPRAGPALWRVLEAEAEGPDVVSRAMAMRIKAMVVDVSRVSLHIGALESVMRQIMNECDYSGEMTFMSNFGPALISTNLYPLA